jgi:hypothetical protein
MRPARARELLVGLDAPWWIAGGWALDLYLGTEGPHGDLDVMVLRRDERCVHAALPGWELREASASALWARPAGTEPWQLELVLDDADGDEWTYRRDPRVRRPLAGIGWESDGLPVLVPEIALLFKATAPERSRFDEVAPALDAAARAWLREALELAHPGHAWLAELG